MIVFDLVKKRMKKNKLVLQSNGGYMHLKKSVKRKLIFLLIIILICVGVLCYFKFFDTKKARKVKVIDEIKEYSYQLKDSKSKLYKDEFKNLEKILAKKMLMKKNMLRVFLSYLS